MQTAGADMTPNDLDRKAREPKFGDWLRGVYASERNPIRDGIYVRTCRVNHETCYELTDGKGKFWMYPKRSTERLDRPNAFDAAALRLAVPEGFVVVPREPTAELMAAASIAVWPMASAADVEMAKRAADIVLRESMDLQPGATRDMLAASIATMAPAYRAMLAAAAP